MNNEEKDVLKAGVICFIWLIGFIIGAFTGELLGFKIISASTAVFSTVVYLSFLREHFVREQREQRRRAAIREDFLREMAAIEIERGEKYDVR